MSGIKPVYIKLLIGAIVIFVMGVSIMLSDLCSKVGQLGFEMMHVTGACPVKHAK